MAHLLDNSKGFNAFVSKGVPAWHGLGVVLDNPISTADALKQGRLDFNVIKMPNIQVLSNGVEQISERSFFTERTDVCRVLGDRMGVDYTVMQNIEALNVADEILQAGAATIETAGSLDGGKKVFICLKLNKNIVVGSVADTTMQYVLICNSHDGSMAVRIMFTNVRVVCANTLAAALGDATGNIAIRHTIGAAERLKIAAKTMKLITENTEINAENYNVMAQKIVSTQQMFDYFGNIFLDEKEIKALQAGGSLRDIASKQKQNTLKDVLYTTQKGIGQALTMKGSDFTAWSMYNGVTNYLSRKKFDSPDQRADSLLFGINATRIQLAGDLALAPEKIKKLSRSNFGSGLNLN